MARDLRGCVDAGFRVDTVLGVDLFPQTHHVEGLALVTSPKVAAKSPGRPR
jgi:23S rRNA (uracil1939-C5)-methyltransferase